MAKSSSVNASMSSVQTEQGIIYMSALQKQHKCICLDRLKMQAFLSNARVLFGTDPHEEELELARERLQEHIVAILMYAVSTEAIYIHIFIKS